MTYPVSACVFIRNNNAGAFCLWESAASILHLVEQFIVLDLMSDDGTWETLQEIAKANPKFELHRRPWPRIDAGVFADLANELIQMSHYPAVWYYQADEVPHQVLLSKVKERFDRGEFDLSFWRIQYRENWQRVKWFPHLVHRVGPKDKFNFIGDGMTSDRTFDARICSDYGGEMFPKWGALGQEGIKPYVNQMLLDVSQVGAFRDNIIEKRALHAPFWHEDASIEGRPADQWAREALENPNWTKAQSPYDLPVIMRFHIGRTRYEARSELIEAIKRDQTQEFLGLVDGWK